MDRDVGVLVDILLAARDVLRFKASTSRDEFLGSKLIQSAVLHKLTVIGEAARRLSPGFREGHRDIPWGKVIALRNFLVHEYERIDPKIVWHICERYIPALVAFCEPRVGQWAAEEED